MTVPFLKGIFDKGFGAFLRVIQVTACEVSGKADLALLRLVSRLIKKIDRLVPEGFTHGGIIVGFIEREKEYAATGFGSAIAVYKRKLIRIQTAYPLTARKD